MDIMTTGTESNLNCGATSTMRLSKDHRGQKSIYSALLTAKTTKTDIGIRIIPNSAACDISYIRY